MPAFLNFFWFSVYLVMLNIRGSIIIKCQVTIWALIDEYSHCSRVECG